MEEQESYNQAYREPNVRAREAEFQTELASLLNRFGKDDECNTPDYILANHLLHTINNLKKVNELNRAWSAMMNKG